MVLMGFAIAGTLNEIKLLEVKTSLPKRTLMTRKGNGTKAEHLGTTFWHVDEGCTEAEVGCLGYTPRPAARRAF